VGDEVKQSIWTIPFSFIARKIASKNLQRETVPKTGFSWSHLALSAFQPRGQEDESRT
jgi:hypothetical protein